MSKEHLGSGLYNFFDIVMLAASGWIFWVLVAKFVPTIEIGYATTMLAVIGLITGLLGFGLDFVLLKESDKRAKSFLTILLFEILVHSAAVPILYFVSSNFYEDALVTIIPISIFYFMLSPFFFTIRFTMLGKLASKTAFFIDIVGTAVKFGVISFSNVLGANGILIALVSSSLITIILGYATIKSRYVLEQPQLSLLKKNMKDSYFNIFNKYSRIFLVNLSIVFIGIFITDPVDVAAFYMAIMIFLATNGMTAGILLMALPASQKHKESYFPENLKLAMLIITPILSLVVSAPAFVLETINPDYTVASNSLLILAFAVIPATLIAKIIMRLNHENNHRQLALLGICEGACLVVLLLVLTWHFGLIGSATAVLLSTTIPIFFTRSSVDKQSAKITCICTAIVLLSAFLGSYLNLFHLPLLNMAVCGIVSLSIIFGLKLMRISEITTLVSALKK